MTTEKVVITRILPASIERVFAACSRPELLSRWLVCGEHGTATVTNEFQVGGRFHIAMQLPGGGVAGAEGEYVEIVPPRRLVFTWIAAHVGVASSVVTIDLAARGAEQTELRLIHSVDPCAVAGERHARGWTTALTTLHRFLKEQL